MQGALPNLEYWVWLRELTMRKVGETDEEIRHWCQVAATENKAAGVGLIVEHSDRPFAAEALREVGIKSVVLQELITFDEAPDTAAKWAAVDERREQQGANALTPHATWTVDRESLKRFSEQPFVSIHAAESFHERDLFESHSGPIADFFRGRNKTLPQKQSILDMLDEVRLLRRGVQLVHVGAIEHSCYERLAEAEVMIAHCPRSNLNLGCPLPDVRRMIDVGLKVGLGMDSAASSGPIDMFAEMRAMMSCSAVSASEAWRIACDADASAMSAEGLTWNLWTSRAETESELIELGGKLEI